VVTRYNLCDCSYLFSATVLEVSASYLATFILRV
jgi:hypothetical protein